MNTMRKIIKRIIAITVIAYGLSGCVSAGTQIEWDRARQVQAGMTQPEVIALMGRPYSVTSRGEGRQTWVWVYVNAFAGSQSAALNFQDGRVLQAFEIPDSFR